MLEIHRKKQFIEQENAKFPKIFPETEAAGCPTFPDAKVVAPRLGKFFLGRQSVTTYFGFREVARIGKSYAKS